MPNVRWRAVPASHLRAHPCFSPLPRAYAVRTLSSWRDVSLFDQSSAQWDALHVGRLTTSRMAAAMGVLEPRAAAALGVPRGLQGSSRARAAFRHMCESSSSCLETLEDAEALLVDMSLGTGAESERRYLERMEHDLKALDAYRRQLWRRQGGRGRPRFAAEYAAVAQRTKTDTMQRRGRGRGSASGGMQLDRATRMSWGCVHEATAVLVAVNHFHRMRRDALVLECGMFPSEGLLEPSRRVETWEHAQLKLLLRCHEAGLKLGASPDGVIVHRDGRHNGPLVVEALEVKNHSPFQQCGKKCIVRDRSPSDEVPPWYVPQLQLEMMMIGPHCRSAILVRLTATKGATVMRLPRDDAYIEMMLARALFFHQRFVRKGTVPPQDFGYGDGEEEGEAHDSEEGGFSVRDAVEMTRRVAASASLVQRVAHRDVQRARPNDVPLII